MQANNQYLVFGVRDGYNVSIEHDIQLALYEFFKRTDNFYKLITMYYDDDRLVNLGQY